MNLAENLKIKINNGASAPNNNNWSSTMIRVTFHTYSAVLDKSFVNVKDVKTMADFKLYATALYSGNWSVISAETI